jgi:hypothetical protein
VIENLSRAYAALNKSLFKSKLSPVNFIQDLSEKYVLHLKLPDVVIVGGGFAEGKVIDVLDSLVHIMVHLDNYRIGIVDFTSNQYHRREFCEKAIEVGLIVAYHKTRGWSLTYSDSESETLKHAEARYPTPKAAGRLKSAYEQVAPFCSAIHHIRRDIRKDLSRKTTRGFQLKYVCACDPPVIVRSGRRPDGPNPLNVSCNVCGTKFVLSQAD